MSEAPREYTTDEVRELFIGHVDRMIFYWKNLQPDPNLSEAEVLEWRLEGLTHSIFATLDGCTSLPGFIVAPMPHETDREFHQDEGVNWFPENNGSAVRADIAGELRYWRRTRS